MANDFFNKRRRLQEDYKKVTDQATLLGSIANEIRLGAIDITVSLGIWNEIRSYTCLVIQERRVSVTETQPHKKHRRTVTNRGLQRRSS